MMFDTDYNFPRSVHQRWMFDAFRIPGVLGEVLGEGKMAQSSAK